MKTTKSVVKYFERGPIVRYQYDNGAVFLYHCFPNISRVCFSVTFAVGSIQESKKEFGIAHLIEHLIFKSARNHPEFGNLIEKLEKFGAEINAYTSKDHTCFELMCNKRNFKFILPLFFRIFDQFNINDKEFEAEKKIVIHELREDLNVPGIFVEEKLIEENFKDKFSHSIGGSISSVKNITLKQVNSFYKKFYCASRMIISQVSEIDNKVVKTNLIRFFKLRGEIKKNKPFRYEIRDKFSKINQIKRVYKKNVETPMLTIGFSAPSLNSRFRGRLILIDQLLNDGLNSLFFKATREDNALSYGIGSSVNSFFDKGHYLISLNTTPVLIDKARSIIFKTIFEDLPQFMTQEILDNEKLKLRDFWELSFDDADERIEYIQKMELYGKLNVKMNEIGSLISDITVDDIKEYLAMMKKYGYSEIIVYPINYKGKT